MLTARAKKFNEECIFASVGAKRSKKIWARFRDTYGSQIEKHLRVFLASVEIINMRCCEKKRENSFLFKFKLPVSLRILYILPFSHPLQPASDFILSKEDEPHLKDK